MPLRFVRLDKEFVGEAKPGNGRGASEYDGGVVFGNNVIEYKS